MNFNDRMALLLFAVWIIKWCGHEEKTRRLAAWGIGVVGGMWLVATIYR